MTDHQLFIGALFVISLVLAAVIAHMNHIRQKELRETGKMFSPALEALLRIADRKLADYGQALAPIHDGIGMAGTLVDEIDDPVVLAIARAFRASPEKVIAALGPIIKAGQDLTDGVPAAEPDVPPQEHVRAGQFDEAPK